MFEEDTEWERERKENCSALDFMYLAPSISIYYRYEIIILSPIWLKRQLYIMIHVSVSVSVPDILRTLNNHQFTGEWEHKRITSMVFITACGAQFFILKLGVGCWKISVRKMLFEKWKRQKNTHFFYWAKRLNDVTVRLWFPYNKMKDERMRLRGHTQNICIPKKKKLFFPSRFPALLRSIYLFVSRNETPKECCSWLVDDLSYES